MNNLLHTPNTLPCGERVTRKQWVNSRSRRGDKTKSQNKRNYFHPAHTTVTTYHKCYQKQKIRRRVAIRNDSVHTTDPPLTDSYNQHVNTFMTLIRSRSRRMKRKQCKNTQRSIQKNRPLGQTLPYDYYSSPQSTHYRGTSAAVTSPISINYIM